MSPIFHSFILILHSDLSQVTELYLHLFKSNINRSLVIRWQIMLYLRSFRLNWAELTMSSVHSDSSFVSSVIPFQYKSEVRHQELRQIMSYVRSITFLQILLVDWYEALQTICICKMPLIFHAFILILNCYLSQIFFFRLFWRNKSVTSLGCRRLPDGHQVVCALIGHNLL